MKYHDNATFRATALSTFLLCQSTVVVTATDLTNSPRVAIASATAEWDGPKVEPVDLSLLRGERQPPRCSVPEASERLEKAKGAIAVGRFGEATNLLLSCIHDFPASSETVQWVTNAVLKSFMDAAKHGDCDALLVAALRTRPRGDDLWGEILRLRSEIAYRLGDLDGMRQQGTALLAWDVDHPCTRVLESWGGRLDRPLKWEAMAGAVAMEFMCVELDAVVQAIRARKWSEALLRLNGRRLGETMITRAACAGYTGATTGRWPFDVGNCNCKDNCGFLHRPHERVDQPLVVAIDASRDVVDPGAHAVRGRLHELRVGFPEAFSEYVEAGEKDPDMATRLWSKARAAHVVLGMREPARARVLLERLSEEGTNAYVVTARGFAELARYHACMVENWREKKDDSEAIGRFRQSADDYRTAFKQATDRDKWFYGKECALMQMRLIEMGDVTNSVVEVYRKAHKLLKEVADAPAASTALRGESLYWSAECLVKGGFPDEANPLFVRVLREYPETKWAKYAKGRFLPR